MSSTKSQMTGAAETVAAKLLGVLRLEVRMLERRANFLAESIASDRDEGHQPEQMLAVDISNAVHRGLSGYPWVWDARALVESGISNPSQRDFEKLREQVIGIIDSAWG